MEEEEMQLEAGVRVIVVNRRIINQSETGVGLCGVISPQHSHCSPSFTYLLLFFITGRLLRFV
jgi:hypothetical protein